MLLINTPLFTYDDLVGEVRIGRSTLRDLAKRVEIKGRKPGQKGFKFSLTQIRQLSNEQNNPNFADDWSKAFKVFEEKIALLGSQ